MELQKSELVPIGRSKTLPPERPMTRIPVSFLGIGMSLREDNADATLGPASCQQVEYIIFVFLPAPPDPVLRIASPVASSDTLPGTGDRAEDPLDTPAFLI